MFAVKAISDPLRDCVMYTCIEVYRWEPSSIRTLHFMAMRAEEDDMTINQKSVTHSCTERLRKPASLNFAADVA
jgi:NADP-dependent 3-hydroxy acid dehydrogenase YdfG